MQLAAELLGEHPQRSGELYAPAGWGKSLPAEKGNKSPKEAWLKSAKTAATDAFLASVAMVENAARASRQKLDVDGSVDRQKLDVDGSVDRQKLDVDGSVEVVKDVDGDKDVVPAPALPIPPAATKDSSNSFFGALSNAFHKLVASFSTTAPTAPVHQSQSEINLDVRLPPAEVYQAQINSYLDPNSYNYRRYSANTDDVVRELNKLHKTVRNSLEAMHEDLVLRYQDGYVLDEDSGAVETPGYPEWWLKAVGYGENLRREIKKSQVSEEDFIFYPSAKNKICCVSWEGGSTRRSWRRREDRENGGIGRGCGRDLVG